MPDDVIDRGVFSELQSTVGAEFAAELIGTFLEEAPGQLAELRTSFVNGDADAFRRAAHSLKSNAQTFGATQLAALARDLEHAALTTHQVENASTLAALETAYAAAAAALTTMKV
jgi:histidine phosphotransfer protein HptB